MRRPLQLVSSASVLLLAGTLLAACTTPEPEPAPTSSTSPSASETPEPSSEPSETPSSRPVDIRCDELVTPQAMYDFNPNFSLIDSWSPSAGSAAGQAVAADGVACRWQNDTSGDTIDVSVASFDEAGIAQKQADAASGTSAPYGWFRIADGAGEAITFEGSYWLVVRSVWFTDPGDATPLVDAALSAL